MNSKLLLPIIPHNTTWKVTSREKNEEIAESLKIETATVQSHMRVIYQKFAENPCGCHALDRYRGGRGQFGKLFSWLWEDKFFEWLAKQQSDDNRSLPPLKPSLSHKS